MNTQDRAKLEEIYQSIYAESEKRLSPFACPNNKAYRLKEEDRKHIRTPFALDRDRILYSGAYRRYQGKTQVFSFTNQIDEEMSNRSIHTTYVSQISRTIGTALRLNIDLIEAIALGHDLGHTPFGHDGEKALSKYCQQHGIGHFHHNIESLHIVDNISRNGKGLNLTFQVRDGIISHDGEVHNTSLIPNRSKTDLSIKDYSDRKKNGEKIDWSPSTLEGCIVRMSDTIAYIGQDIEDAIRYNILSRNDLPKDCVELFGDKNSKIIDYLVKDVILNSYDKDCLTFSEKTSYYLKRLKDFNYEKIYTNPAVKQANEIIYRSMGLLFEKYLNDIEQKNEKSAIYVHFLNHKSAEYLSSFSHPEFVRDFIATMTDRYFNEEVKQYVLPGRYL
ncbi:MAG: HD domain-containing protein [Candidatus Cloacimonetes bacterium]|nr:HD domain-containing protein [Candidatus Cloacimonadota bacterium]